MDEREQLKEEALELLTTIKTLDDVKEHKGEIIEIMVKLLKSALGILKTFFERSFSLSASEKEEEISNFQDDSFLFTKEVNDELERIYDLPGAAEFMDDFMADMEKELEPYMEEITAELEKIMGEFMGNLMGGIVEGLGAAFGGDDAENGEQEISSEPGADEKLDVGTLIYKIESLKDLKKYENRIAGEIKDQLNADLYVLRQHKTMNLPPDDMIRAGHARVEKRQKLLVRELDREFKRIGELPDVGEYAQEVKNKMTKRFKPTVKQINELLAELKPE